MIRRRTDYTVQLRATTSQISQETKLLFGLLDDEEEVTYTRNDATPSRIKPNEEKVNGLITQCNTLNVLQMSPYHIDSVVILRP